MGEKVRDRPKPMLEVGNRPLLWHLMCICSAQGVFDFTIALGYQGQVIQHYFLQDQDFRNHLAIDPKSVRSALDKECLDWRVQLVDTGLSTMTAGRLKRLAPFFRDESHFLMTYGDGLADVDLRALEEFHISHGRLVTLTAVRVPERFGHLSLERNKVISFREKPDSCPQWINGGFFIINPKVLDYIDGDDTIWERAPLERLCAEGELMAFRHEGFWSCVDTPSDLSYLESIWQDDHAPWLLRLPATS